MGIPSERNRGVYTVRGLLQARNCRIDVDMRGEPDRDEMFIVFIALLIVNMTFITYQGDLNRYVRLRDFHEGSCGRSGGGSSPLLR